MGLKVARSWIFISLSNVDFDMSVEPLQYILIKQTLTQIRGVLLKTSIYSGLSSLSSVMNA